MLKAVLFSLLVAASAPSDELFDALKAAPDARAAAQAEADIWASWNDSGSPTADLLMERAAIAEQAGSAEIARALYDRAILVEPGFAEAWHRRALVFMAEENYGEAVRDLNEALVLEPRHFGAWTVLGSVFERLGARKEAAEAYKAALALHPHLPAAKQGAARLAALLEGSSL